MARFGGDPAVVGRRVAVDGRAVEIVGVMPPEFALPVAAPELVLPLPIDPAAAGERGNWDANTVARLRPGVEPAAAQEELRALWRRGPVLHRRCEIAQRLTYLGR